ncbi:MAG: restriction endonuclease subunit S [Proteobacteria bacterium]|nr:restriction endonuclease subunit S [Pseudomonadota bacterium]
MNPRPSAPIRDLCRLVNGRAFTPADWTETGLPIVRIQNLNDRQKPFNRYDGEVKDRFLVADGDILLSWSGSPGTSFGCFVWDRGQAIVNQHIFKVHIDETRIDRDYFVHAVNSRLDEMIALAHGGAGLRHITRSKLESIEIPVPAVDEQRRIVARINACLQRVDEIRALRQEADREAKALLPSSLASVFGELLATCDTMTLGSVVCESRYGISRKCDAGEDAVPVLRIPNIADLEVKLADLKYCALAPTELVRLALEPGDLLVVRTNGSADLVGRCAVFEGARRPFAFASYLIRLRLDRGRADPTFVAMFLASAHGRDAIAAIRRTSAGQYNVNSENLRAIQIPAVPIRWQRKIAERLRDQESVTRAIAAQQAARMDEADHLRAAILRRSISGR